MKVGILTVYFADYGSYYQTVSLYRQLHNMGLDVKIVHESFRYFRSLYLLASSIFYKVAPKIVQDKLRKRFSAYNTYCVLKKDLQNLPIAKPRWRRKNRYQEYDCVIVGSDELWSATNPRVRYIPDYYGIGMTCPHFTYAVSGITLAEDKVSPRMKKSMKRGIKSFLGLSVRDGITKEWVERWLEIPNACEEVLDPTLLNPFFVKHDVSEKNILLVYGEHFLEDQKIAITTFAHKKGYRLVACSFRQEWCDSFLNATCAGDVQEAFAGAAFCAVSTFHGTVFAVASHRKFASFLTPLRGGGKSVIY